MTRDEVFKAIDVADVELLKNILEKDPSLAISRSNDGLSAVLFSLYIEKPEVTEVLLTCEPELDIFDLSALGYVGQLSALLALEPKSVHEYSGDGFTALHIASYFGQHDVVSLLLNQGADVDKVAMNGSDLTALQSAVSRLHVDVVKTILDYKPDLNVKMLGGFTPLMMAAALGSSEIVGVLIVKGADKSICAADGRDAAGFAVSAGHKHLADLF